MASSKKIEEALSHIREAEKGMKTGFLKWRPDYDVAADEYSKAGTCYKTAKQYPQSRDCFLKSTEYHKMCKAFFSAAKSIEQAVLVSKEMGDLESIASLSERAAGLYREHGVPDTAALALDKGAKLIEGQMIDKALHLYRYAVDVVMTEDHPRQAAEYQSKISRHLVRLQRYDEASDSIRREIGFDQSAENSAAIGRLAVALVLVQLARGDTVAAEKAFREWGGYSEQEEIRTMESLLQAFDEDDGDLAKRALSSSFIKHMDVEYSKLARDLPIPKTSEESKKKTGDAFPSSASKTGGGGEEELDLC